jgi:hypothetical protein
LFPTEEKALKFLEDGGLEEARVKLLLKLDRTLEAAAIYAKKGDILKAVETLSPFIARNVDFARRMIEYLLIGLRPGFTLGFTPSGNPTISKLLSFANQLEKIATMEQEFNEVGFSHLFGWKISHFFTSSSRCSRRSNLLTFQLSEPLQRVSSGRRKILLLCCAWTSSSRLLLSFKICNFSRFRHRSRSTLTTFGC